MHDQNSIDASETKEEKKERARCLFLESLYKADHDLRGCAHNQKCYNELLEIREDVIEYVRTLRMDV
jgi:hypothetical protein